MDLTLLATVSVVAPSLLSLVTSVLAYIQAVWQAIKVARPRRIFDLVVVFVTMGLLSLSGIHTIWKVLDVPAGWKTLRVVLPFVFHCLVASFILYRIKRCGRVESAFRREMETCNQAWHSSAET